MKTMKKTISLLLAAVLLPVCPAKVRAEEASEKEEIIYASLDTAGAAEEVYAVNVFGAGDVTDYGTYSSVQMLNTTEPIEQEGDRITFSTEKDKAYYQGKMENTELPWKISLRYYLDGEEYLAEELAGKSGSLRIRFQVEKNAGCSGTFYEDYALQATFTLDAERFQELSAPDATVANAGGSKQLTYTILPGEGIDTVIEADVADFAMSGVSINGIHLNMNVGVDETELRAKVNELIEATEKLDDGADELSGGAETLLDGSGGVKDGALSLHSGSVSLNEGVASLQKGLNTVQEGLDTLNAQSAALTGGSREFREALAAVQTAVHSVSAAGGDLSGLSGASRQILQALDSLCSGAAALQENLGYARYKALMAQNGLDIDALEDGNAQAAAQLFEQAAALEQTEGMAELAASLRQAGELLSENSAAIQGMESYLNGLSAELPTLAEGLSALKTQYGAFDGTIGQLADTLGNMTGNLSALADGINRLAGAYGELDQGIGVYTGGVARVVAGYSQVMDGVSSLAEGSRELASGSGDLYEGTKELYDGVISLCGGAQEMAEGTGEFREETSGMNEEIEEKIDKLLESIGGSTADPVSFVSEKNTNVTSVQFVIRTEAVEKEKIKQEKTAEAEEPSFLQKLLQLFE